MASFPRHLVLCWITCCPVVVQGSMKSTVKTLAMNLFEAHETYQSAQDNAEQANATWGCMNAITGLGGIDGIDAITSNLSSSNLSSSNVTATAVVTHLQNLDICDLVNGMVVHWEEGCSDVFDQMLETQEYLTCHVSLQCRGELGDGVPDFVHGNCLSACEINEEGDNTTVECQLPAIASAGLMDEDICGHDIDITLLYQYHNFMGLFLSTLLAVFVLAFEDAVRSASGEGVGQVSFGDVVTVIFQLFVLLNVLVTAFGALAEAGDTCRFVILASPFTFGPFLYSALTAFQPALKLLAEDVEKWGKTGSAAGSRMEVVEMMLALAWKIMIIGLTILLLGLLAAASVCLVVLTIISFWGIFAYIHISLVMIAFFALLTCSFGCCGYGTTFMVTYGAQKNETDANHVMWKLKMQFGCYCFFMFLAVAAPLFINSFLLFFHGDWNRFHNAFFDEFSIGLPNFPRLHLMSHLDVSFEVLGDILSFRSLSASMLFEMAVMQKLLTLICTIVIRLVMVIARRTCSRNAQGRE